MTDLEILANLRQLSEQRPERESAFLSEVINRFGDLRDQLDSLLQRQQPEYLCVSRSPKWSSVRDRFLAGRSCAACGGTKELVAHHRVPFHVEPDLELEPSNLIPLCEAGRYGLHCHLLLGHLGNWRRWNVDLDSDIQRWASVLITQK